jgi:hypothetical protein
MSIEQFLRPLVEAVFEDGLRTSATALRVAVLSEKIDNAAMLPVGWDSYCALPPNHEAIALARRALATARNVFALPSTITASADGGIALCWDSAERRAYIEFDNDGSAVIAMYDRTSEPYVSEFDPSTHLSDAVSLAHYYISNIER